MRWKATGWNRVVALAASMVGDPQQVYLANVDKSDKSDKSDKGSIGMHCRYEQVLPILGTNSGRWS